MIGWMNWTYNYYRIMSKKNTSKDSSQVQKLREEIKSLKKQKAQLLTRSDEAAGEVEQANKRADFWSAGEALALYKTCCAESKAIQDARMKLVQERLRLAEQQELVALRAEQERRRVALQINFTDIYNIRITSDK